jgi:hypothetical protein
MKKVLALVVLVCGLAAYAYRPSVGVSHHAAVETLSPLDMMLASRELPTESYDAI